MTVENKETKKMKIDDNYYIDSDNYQFLLQKKSIVRSGKKKGEIVYSTVTYHGTLTEALKQYSRIMLREGINECDDIKDAIKLIKQIKNKIEDILGGW